MKSFLKISVLLFSFLFVIPNLDAQRNSSTLTAQRTPEQEASKQTEKMQSELNLTPEQVKSVYEINLRYAQARQKVVNRNDAMQMIKSKDEEIRRVLTAQQNEQLQNIRASRRQVEIGDDVQRMRTNPETRVTNRQNEEYKRSETLRRNSRSEENSSSNESATSESRSTESTRSSLRSSERASQSKSPSKNSSRSGGATKNKRSSGGKR